MELVHVLLVQADEPVQQALSSLIALLPGCELVGTAPTVTQAIAAVARLCPDVLLLDAELPGALGAIARLRAAAEPKQGGPARRLRVVLISVYGCGERAARASGADAYLLADCGPGALQAALRGERAADPPPVAADTRGGCPPGRRRAARAGPAPTYETTC
jgi:DNA-binding NarL/FixJ family response regulator